MGGEWRGFCVNKRKPAGDSRKKKQTRISGPMHRAPGITNGWMIFPSALSQPTRRSLGLGCEVAGMGKRF
jgi:hypothetical protein